MDLSEKYQRMCEKAGEIQRLGPPIYAIDARHYWEKPDGGTHSNIYGNFYSGLVWLPRQDQLQQLVSTDTLYLVRGLSNFLDDMLRLERGFIGMRMPCMEQLWLAFVMHEKFNKVWDDKDNQWVLQT